MNCYSSQIARFCRFSGVGIIGSLLQLALLYILTQCAHLHPVPAVISAVEITLLHNFAWHERFTWKDRIRETIPQRAARLWKFHASNGVVSLSGNAVITYGLVKWFKAPVLVAGLTGIIICSALNFVIADRWVYSE